MSAFIELLKEKDIEKISMNEIAEKANVNRSEVSVQFLASAITGVLEWWFTNSMPCSSDRITEELWSLLQNNHVI